MGMILALMSVMMTVTSSIRDGKERLQNTMANEYGVLVAFELLESASDTCVAVDSFGQSGVVGTVTELSIHASAVAVGAIGQEKNYPSPLFDLEQLRFSLRNTDLMIGDDVSEAGILIPSVVAIRFQYFDGEDWQSSWDSGQQGLPHAIELSVWTGTWPEGMSPSWMPEENIQEDAPEDAGSFFSDEDIESSKNLENDFYEVEDEEPKADYRRVIAIFSPSPSQQGINSLGVGGGQRP